MLLSSWVLHKPGIPGSPRYPFCIISLFITICLVSWQAEGAATPPRAINTWLVAGPFDNTDYAGFDRDDLGEDAQSPLEGGKAGGRTWRMFDDRLYCRNLDDYNDLYTFFHPKREGGPGGPNEWVAAYAHVYVWSPEQQACELWVGSNDGFQAWLNDTKVASVEGKLRQAARGQDRTPITLEAGWNRLLLKIANAYGVWGFYASIRHPDSAPMDGLEYATKPPNGPLEITTNTMPRGYSEWPYVWLALNIPEAERTNTLAEIESNNPSASPFRFMAAGGTPPYRWRITGGALPDGLTLDEAEGELQGVCAHIQEAQFTVEATDSTGSNAQAHLAISVLERPNAWHEHARLGALIHNMPGPNGKAWLGDPERQASLMAAAGYSYAAMMSKNDGGNAYWPTDIPNSAGKSTGADWEQNASRDLVGPLANALRARDMRAGFYYPFIESENNGLGGDDYASNFPRYMDVRLAQVEELCLAYRPAVMWFDGANVIFSDFKAGKPRGNHELDALYSMIKTFVPECLVLANAGTDIEYGLGDIDALVCESEGAETLDWRWGRWPNGQKGYSPKKLSDETWRFPNTDQAFLHHGEYFHWEEWARVVVSMACEGVMCNLDHSEWPDRYTHSERMRLAEWLKPRLHTLEGTRPGPLKEDLWGYNVIKNNTLYLHILHNPRGKYGFEGKSSRGLPENMAGLLDGRGFAQGLQREMKVGPIAGNATRVYQEPLGMNLDFRIEDSQLIINMQRVVVDDIDTIIAIEMEPATAASSSSK